MSSRKAGLRQFGLQYNYGFNNQSTGRKQSEETLQNMNIKKFSFKVQFYHSPFKNLITCKMSYPKCLLFYDKIKLTLSTMCYKRDI